MDNGEIIRVVVEYTSLGASIGQTVHWYEFQGPGVADSLVTSTITSWLTNDWGPEWRQLSSPDSELTSWEGDVINPDFTVDRNFGGASIGLAGTTAGQAAAAADSALMIAGAGVPTKKGKKYAPFLSTGIFEDGVLNSTALSVLADLFDEYVKELLVIIGSNLAAGILSRVDGLFYAFPGGGTITSVPAYQRRRKPGVGI